MNHISHGRRYLKSRMFDPTKPIRTKAREELKSLGGAPSGGTHTPRTRTALHDSPLLPSKSTSNTDAPGGEEWHDAMPLLRKKRKMTTSCAAHRKGEWEKYLTSRERQKKRARMLQLQPRLRPWIARRNYYEHVMHNWLWLISFCGTFVTKRGEE